MHHFVYKPFIFKALRYGSCVTRGSHSFTCHPHTNHTCLYSPAARCHHHLAGTYLTYEMPFCVLMYMIVFNKVAVVQMNLHKMYAMPQFCLSLQYMINFC